GVPRKFGLVAPVVDGVGDPDPHEDDQDLGQRDDLVRAQAHRGPSAGSATEGTVIDHVAVGYVPVQTGGRGTKGVGAIGRWGAEVTAAGIPLTWVTGGSRPSNAPRRVRAPPVGEGRSAAFVNSERRSCFSRPARPYQRPIVRRTSVLPLPKRRNTAAATTMIQSTSEKSAIYLTPLPPMKDGGRVPRKSAPSGRRTTRRRGRARSSESRP